VPWDSAGARQHYLLHCRIIMSPAVKTTEKDGNKATMAEIDFLSTSAKGASYMILLQLLTRLLSFTLNQLLLRYITPSIFGFATVQLELLSGTVLFLSREGFRIAVQRERGDLQRIVNVAYIPFLTGVPATLVGCYSLWRGADAEVRQLGGFTGSIVLYGIATLVELAVEPCFAITQQMFLFRVRTTAEGTAVLTRCVITYISTIYFTRRGQLVEGGALPFGLGQLAYAVILAGVYSSIISKRASLTPRKITDGSVSYWFHRPTLWLAFSVTGQSLFKHLLTEGDKVVLTILTTSSTQGIYALVSNYGIR
jgi:oligosaccharide translocation protein RFT1